MTAVPADLLASVNKVLQSRDARPRPALPEGRGQLKVRAAADTTELLLYDEIGYWGITATDVVKALADISSPQITLRVSSPGGDVFDGIAIFNALRGHPATVNVVVDSLAASAASFIAMAGDTITVNDAAQVMIHDASGFAYGNAADMEHMRALLDRVSDTIAGIYAGRAGGTVADWRQVMRAETWFSGPEAVAAGLADAAATPPPEEPEGPEEGPSASARWDLTCFTYAGRLAAPAPALPERRAQTDSASFDVAAFRDAMKGAFA